LNSQISETPPEDNETAQIGSPTYDQISSNIRISPMVSPRKNSHKNSPNASFIIRNTDTTLFLKDLIISNNRLREEISNIRKENHSYKYEIYHVFFKGFYK